MGRNKRKFQERRERRRREGKGQEQKVGGGRNRWEQRRARGNEGTREIWKEK